MQAADVIAHGEDPRPVEEALAQYAFTSYSPSHVISTYNRYRMPGLPPTMVTPRRTAPVLLVCPIGSPLARSAASRPTHRGSPGSLPRCALVWLLHGATARTYIPLFSIGRA